jgi:putative endonuclease
MVAFFLFSKMYYIYILHSQSADKYYIGYTRDFKKRLDQHNTADQNTFTGKHIPWRLAVVFECGTDRRTAVKIEKFIKKQKSRVFIERIIEGDEFTGILAPLVRVVP